MGVVDDVGPRPTRHPIHGRLRIFRSRIFIVKFLFLQQVVLVIKPGTAFSPSSQPKRFAGSESGEEIVDFGGVHGQDAA